MSSSSARRSASDAFPHVGLFSPAGYVIGRHLAAIETA
jgi:hypothetical protein